MSKFTPSPHGQGDRITTSIWNRILEVVGQFSRMSVGPNMTLRYTKGAPVFDAIPPLNRLGISTSSITARSSKTPGHGTVQPYSYNGTALAESGAPIKVYNWTGTVVATSKWVQYMQIDGAIFLVGNDCSTVAP